MFELYTHPMSLFAKKVRIVLAEKGLHWKNLTSIYPTKKICDLNVSSSIF